MDIRNRRELKAAAARSLTNAAYDPKKLVLIYTGVALALSLISLVLDYFLDQQISGTGGLSGIGTRSVLETVQSLVAMAQSVAMLFWTCGWRYTTIQLYRGEQVSPASLLQGFRRFGPVLRLMLLVLAIYYAACVVIAIVVIAFVFAMAVGLVMANFEQIAAGTDLAAMDGHTILQAMNGFWPVLVIALVVILVALAFFSYRLRLMQYFVMDHPEQGVVAAIKNSWKQMKGNVFAMFKLDMSFLWFALPDALVAMILYLDTILPALGMELPVSAEIRYFSAFVLYAVCQLGLYWWRKGYVDVTYAAAYDALREPEEQPAQIENEGTAAG